MNRTPPNDVAWHVGIDIGGSSVKAAAIRGGRIKTARAGSYERPSLTQLAGSVREALDALCLVHAPERLGLCLPGKLDPDRIRIKRSVNIPALNGNDPRRLVAGLVVERATIRVMSDTLATGLGSNRLDPVEGTLLCICLGTGVGASLLHDGVPWTFDGSTAGHFGQIDVSLGDDAPTGPDGGRGSLEAYVGLPALRQRFGNDVDGRLKELLGSLSRSDPVLRALSRALRVAHAIYTPDHIRLHGGVGIALGPCIPVLRELVGDQLTSVSSSGWTLTASDDAFLAAIGAAAACEADPS